ncbi:putative two-component system response regulator [Candidatus Magnetomoraceae bacterium gMMP-15]
MSKNKPRVLCIDDDDMIRYILGVHLKDNGFEVECAGNGEIGLELFYKNTPDIILVDLNMPAIDGFGVLRTVTKEAPELPVIVVSGTGDLKSAIKAIRLGAWDYITKPIGDMIVFDLAIQKALERAYLIRENRLYRTDLEKKVHQRTIELEKANENLKTIINEIVNSLGKITEKRDPYTAGHQERVAILATAMAEEMKLSQDVQEGIKVAALLHDIGKIYVPAEFLAKPTRLSKFEMIIIREHATVGYEILKAISFPWPVADIIHQHHERMNGSGYPQGLHGDKLLIESRIIAVADTVEAMSSHRPYRPALGIDKALKEIKDKRGILYCPKCVDACCKIFANNKMIINSFNIKS